MLGWALVGGAALGYGLALRWVLLARGEGSRARDPFEVFASFWAGVAVIVGVLHVAHFAWPVTPGVAWGVFGPGLLMLGWRWADLGCVVSWVREQRWAAAVVGVFGLWLLNRAIGPGDAHDSGLYHFNVMRWTQGYAVVTGIANLAGPLGMNQSGLLLISAVDHLPPAGRGHHVVNSLLTFSVLTQAGAGMVRLVKGSFGGADREGPGDERGARVFDASLMAAMLPVVVLLGVSKDISSPKTDLNAGLAVIALVLMLSRLVVGPVLSSFSRASGRVHAGVVLALVSTLAPCLKLSAAPAAFAVWVVAGVVLVLRSGAAKRRVLLAVAMVSTSLAVFGPWVARSVILSGYPLFPTRVVQVDVPWRVPDDHVEYLRRVISVHGQGEMPLFVSKALSNTPFRALTRLTKPPFEDRFGVSGVNWVRAWFFSMPFVAPSEVVLPAGLALLACLGLLGSGRGFRRGDPGFGGVRFGGVRVGDVGGWGLVLLPAAVGVVAWFVAAPVGRYAWSLWWLVAGVVFAAWMGRAGGLGGLGRWARRATLGLVLVAVVTPIASRMAIVGVLSRENPLRTLPFQGAGSAGGFHATPSVELGIVTTRHGVDVYVPMLNEPELVWDSPLPACPWPPVDMDLAMRRAGDLGGGFEIRRDGRMPRAAYPGERHDPRALGPSDPGQR